MRFGKIFAIGATPIVDWRLAGLRGNHQIRRMFSNGGRFIEKRLTMLSMPLCLWLIVYNLAICVGYGLLFKRLDGDPFGWALACVVLGLMAPIGALQVFARLWPDWWESAAAKLFAFGGVLLAGWYGASRSRADLSGMFKLAASELPSAYGAGAFLAGVEFFALACMLATLLLEVLVIFASAISGASDGWRWRQWSRMLALALVFAAMYLFSASYSQLFSSEVRKLIIGRIAWDFDLIEPVAACAGTSAGKSERRMLPRQAGEQKTVLFRAAGTLPDKPFWRFDLFERARFSTFDSELADCRSDKVLMDDLSKVETHQKESRHYWGIQPIGRSEHGK